MDVAGVIGTQPLIFIRVHPLFVSSGTRPSIELRPLIKRHSVKERLAAKSEQIGLFLGYVLLL
jgi:hypothetical protein